MTSDGVTYVMVARLEPHGVEHFDAYERRMQPIIVEHGGRLERRLVSVDRLTEVHVVWFPSPAGFASYRSDERRVASAHLLADSGAAIEIIEARDL